MNLEKILISTLPILLLLTVVAFGQQNNCKDIDKIFKAQEISVNQSDIYESANVCGVCHDNFFKAWKESLMGKTYSSPVFQAIFADARKTMGDSILDNCNKCHMPMENKSEDASDELLAEGVNCDFCHTIKAVDVYTDAGSYISAPGRAKKASIADAKSPYHPSEADELLTNPRLCASCHEYVIHNGNTKLIIEDTYTQYKDSSFGKTNRSCTECHFPKTDGKIANLDLAPFRNGGKQHTFFGNADKQKFIESAVDLNIKPFIKKALDIEVICNNKAQGHAFPGGANYFRQLVLTLRGYDDENNQIWSYDYVFGRWYEDRFGTKTFFPWKAEKMVYNRLLRPDRLEEVRFELTKKIRVFKVVATLDYWAMPPELVKQYNLDVKPIRVATASARPSDY